MCSWGYSPLGRKSQLVFCFSIPRCRGALSNLDKCLKYVLVGLPRDIKVIVVGFFLMALRKPFTCSCLSTPSPLKVSGSPNAVQWHEWCLVHPALQRGPRSGVVQGMKSNEVGLVPMGCWRAEILPVMEASSEQNIPRVPLCVPLPTSST